MPFEPDKSYGTVASPPGQPVPSAPVPSQFNFVPEGEAPAPSQAAVQPLSLPAPVAAPPPEPPLSAMQQLILDDPNNPNIMGVPTDPLQYKGILDKKPKEESLAEAFFGKNLLDYVNKRREEMPKDQTFLERAGYAADVYARSPSMVSDFVKGAGRIAMDAAKAPTEFLEDIEWALPGVVSTAQVMGMPMGLAALEFNSGVEAMQRDLDKLPSAGSQVVDGLGGMTVFMLGGALAAPELGADALLTAGVKPFLSPALAAGGLGAAAEASALSDEAQAAEGAKPWMGLAAYGAGSLLGMTEAVEGAWFVNRLNKMSKGALEEFIKRNNYFQDIPGWVAGEAVKGFAWEGAQEGLQTLGENWVARDIVGYDPDRSLSDNVGMSIITGGFLGGAVGYGIGKINSGNKQAVMDEFTRNWLEKTLLGGTNLLDADVPFTPMQDGVMLRKEAMDIQAALQVKGEAALLREQLAATGGQEGVTVSTPVLVEGRIQNAGGRAVDIFKPVGLDVALPPEMQVPKTTEFAWARAPEMRDFISNVSVDAAVHPEAVVKDAQGKPVKVAETGQTQTKTILDTLNTEQVAFADLNPWLPQEKALQEAITLTQDNLTTLDMDFRAPGSLQDPALYKATKKALQKDLREMKRKQTVFTQKKRILKKVAASVVEHMQAMQSVMGKGTKFVVTDGSYLQNSALFGKSRAQGAYGAIYPVIKDVPTNSGGTMRVALMYLNMDGIVNQVHTDEKLQRDLVKKAKDAGASKGKLKKMRQQVKKRPWFKNDAGRELFRSINHEMGHRIVTNHVNALIARAKAGDEQAARVFFALVDEYEQWLLAAAGSPLEFFTRTAEAVASLNFARSMAADKLDPNATVRSTTNPLVPDDRVASYSRYLYSFDEYMADKIAKMLQAENSPLAKLLPESQFLLQVGESFKEFFNGLPEDIKHVYDSNWQDYLRTFGIDARLEDLKRQKPVTLLDILTRNFKALGFEPDDFAGMRGAMDTWGWVQKTGQTLLQNARDNPHVKPFKEYVGTVVQWAAFIRANTAPTNLIIQALNDLGKSATARIAEILFDEANNQKRMPMADILTKLDPVEAEQYVAVRKELDRVLSMMEDVTIRDAQRVWADNAELLKVKLEEIKKEFTAMRDKAYFPFMRFGKYTLFIKAREDLVFDGEKVKAGETVTFQSFETQKERDKATAELQRQLGQKVTYSRGVMTDTDFAIQGMPRSMLVIMRRNLQAEGVTPEQLEVIDKAIASTTPFQSFRKHWMKKKGIHGYSEDMMRSFASYMRMATGHLARVEYAPQLFDQIRQMDSDIQIMKHIGEDTEKRQYMREWLGRHFSYIMNPSNEWTALRGAISVAYLGLNIKSAALQLVQIPQVVYPYLASRYGDTDAVSQLTKAPWILKDYILDPLRFVPKAPKAPDFKKRMKGTKVVNEQGEPIRLYHATTKEFKDFDQKFSSKDIQNATLGEGFYFSDDPKAISDIYLDQSAQAGTNTDFQPGANIRPVYLNLKNPARDEDLQGDKVRAALQEEGIDPDDPDEIFTDPAAITRALKKAGFDGIIHRPADGAFTEYVAFDSAQIVSAFEDQEMHSVNDLPEKERIGQMLHRGQAEQWLDQSYATELAIASSENNLTRGLSLGNMAKSTAKQIWHGSTKFMMYPFHITEKANRYVTAIAAYRLEFERSGDHEQAILAAREANWSANFEYARWNRPEFARGKKSVAFMFSSFWQNSLYFATKDPGAHRYWLVMLFLAGLMGLPFADDLEDLLSATLTFFKEKLGYKDPYTDLETDVREFLHEANAPPYVADYLLHGTSQDSFGLGLIEELTGMPVPRIDVSSSLSLGDIVPGTELPQNMLNSRGSPSSVNDLIADTAESATGAAGSMTRDLLAAALSGNYSDWKAVEKLIPFMFVRNASKALRQGSEGEKTKAGEMISTFDTGSARDISELVAQGLGATPKRTSQGWEEYMATKSLIRYYEARKRTIQSQLNKSFMMEDREAQADMINAVVQFNATVPYPEFMITDPGQGVKEYMTRQVTAGVIGIADKKYIRIKQKLEATYGTGDPMKSSDIPGTVGSGNP